MRVKADFHVHTNEDPMDDLSYTPYQYLDAAAKKGFKVVALTHHRELIFSEKYTKYGKKKGILVIPGFEATIEGQDVVILNPTTDKITTWKELEREKRKNQCLTILAHPFWHVNNIFYPKILHKNAHLFDAIEISWLQPWWFRLPNMLARGFARKHNKPLVGNGDIHKLEWIGNTYSEIEVKKLTTAEVFRAIKNKKVKPVQNNIPTLFFLKLALKHITGGVVKRKT
jgi:predicted metal-dependent phosphoesterase TrpH